VREKPRRRGFFQPFSQPTLGDRTVWLVRQCRVPPALPVFADNREFYREFCKIAVLGTLETAINCVVRGLQGANSLLNGTGNYFIRTGSLACENREICRQESRIRHAVLFCWHQPGRQSDFPPTGRVGARGRQGWSFPRSFEEDDTCVAAPIGKIVSIAGSRNR